MDDRFRKYMDNNLDISELEMLRKDVADMSDDELSSILDELACADDFTNEDIDTIQHRLNTEIKSQRRSKRIVWLTTAAAAILVLALMLCGVFMYNMHQKYQVYEGILSHQVTIGTQPGENISTMLPDGSKIVMSPSSSLAYKLADFNQLERKVVFSGEAKFSIVKNEKAPFWVHSKYFDIKVLGTVFSVLSRDNKDVVEVHLDEGSIELTAAKSNHRKILKSGETAVIYKTSGDLKVFDGDDDYRYSAGQSTLFFKSEKLNKVFAELTMYYGKKFDVDDIIARKTFTGSLPTDDLEQALYILEQTLKIKVSMQGDTYIIK